MRKKRNDFDAVGVERMTDAELSKKLGSYQRTESIGMLLGILRSRSRPAPIGVGNGRSGDKETPPPCPSSCHGV